jgi:hypothetical protein
MTPSELFQKLTKLPTPEFGKLFTSMESSAFRLEALDVYSIPGEEEDLARFRKGQKPPHDTNAQWAQTIGAAISRGVDFQRVRLVRKPVSEYVRFETEWGYKFNVPAGEQTFALFYEDVITFRNEVPILKDFWLFDNSRCFLMAYDFWGRFLGVNEIPREAVPAYVQLKAECLERAVDIQKTFLWNAHD